MLEARLIKKRCDFILDVELRVGSEILVLLGPSGAGKTTILQCLAGLVRPDSGRIKLRGRILFDTNPPLNRPVRDRLIGYVFQDYLLLPHMTVWRNITYGCIEDVTYAA
ncbi:MAG: ATP-binding cassette domain-containing protein [Clostridia bacterium]|nr:ATP-binding cassette domain-containing protein [Clostridia bacterium]